MAMATESVIAGLKTPLSKIGELSDELFLACLQSVPCRLQDVLVSKWSAQLSRRKQTHH